MWLIMILACKLGGNNPPRFQQFNGIDVKYLFGIAYIPETEYLYANTGDKVEWDIKVRDADGDAIELLFPGAPATVHFDSDSTTGYWQVPDSPISDYAGFQIVAVDERDASDVLFVNYIIEDYVYDTGEWLSIFSTKLYGEINVENGWIGEINFTTDIINCTWSWSETIGYEDSLCPNCIKTWTIELRRGTQTSGECGDLEELLNEIEQLKIGWAPSATIDGIHYSNPIFQYVDGEGWIPNGNGSLIGNRLNFELELY
jgi:hypothetical protein